MHPLGAESVSLDAAFGRVLAADITAPIELPPWDNASMDGYAVRAQDMLTASPESPARLNVVGTIAAGMSVTAALRGGEAFRIMTGAPVPAGADSVVRVEDTDAGTRSVSIVSARDANRNVRPRGEDIMAGDIAGRVGDVLHPGLIGLVASLGYGSVSVTRRPRVAILASGDELVDVDEFDQVRAGRRIVSSNSYSLIAAIQEAGAVPLSLGRVGDDPVAIRDRLAGVECDLLITTGGVSVGEFDHTRSVLAELGAEHRFWRVKIRPGAPVGFGVWRGRPWLGLPGNPVSTLVTFELFARPAIRKMLGHRLCHIGRLLSRPARRARDSGGRGDDLGAADAFPSRATGTWPGRGERPVDRATGLRADVFDGARGCAPGVSAGHHPLRARSGRGSDRAARGPGPLRPTARSLTSRTAKSFLIGQLRS